MIKLWMTTAALLALVWAVFGSIVWWARGAKPSVASLERIAREEKLEAAPPAKRAEIITEAAQQLQRLSADERREVHVGRKLEALTAQMTPAEKVQFLEQTAPAGLQQALEVLNKMDPERRKRAINRALGELRTAAESLGQQAPDLHDPAVQRMIQEGMKSFSEGASPETKMDVAPLLEELQKRLQKNPLN